MRSLMQLAEEASSTPLSRQDVGCTCVLRTGRCSLTGGRRPRSVAPPTTADLSPPTTAAPRPRRRSRRRHHRPTALRRPRGSGPASLPSDRPGCAFRPLRAGRAPTRYGNMRSRVPRWAHYRGHAVKRTCPAPACPWASRGGPSPADALPDDRARRSILTPLRQVLPRCSARPRQLLRSCSMQEGASCRKTNSAMSLPGAPGYIRHDVRARSGPGDHRRDRRGTFIRESSRRHGAGLLACRIWRAPPTISIRPGPAQNEAPGGCHPPARRVRGAPPRANSQRMRRSARSTTASKQPADRVRAAATAGQRRSVDAVRWHSRRAERPRQAVPLRWPQNVDGPSASTSPAQSCAWLAPDSVRITASGHHDQQLWGRFPPIRPRHWRPFSTSWSPTRSARLADSDGHIGCALSVRACL